jgi:DNA-binding SARP family transcriptional activator
VSAMPRTFRQARQQAALLGKLTRPRPVAALARPRLFRALDEARRHPAVWVLGPPGAGKTTLVSTYVAQRRLRTIWYRMQNEDADPATFFHYFGLAVDAATPRLRKAQLPHLTPEYSRNLAVFSRRYFEQVYRRLKAPCLLVLDDCQEVAQNAPLHEVMRELVESLPFGVNLIVLSRGEAPPSLAPLRARESIALLGGEELKLTAKECGDIAELRGIHIDAAALQQLYRRTQGWTAGVVLALEQKAPPGDAAALPAEATPQVLFDYFAGDIFGKMAPDVQAMLLRASLLPSMAAHRVAELTGLPHADRALGDLARSNYFTLKLAQVHGAPPALYQFHPLFREFLLRRAQETLAPAELTRLRRRAAVLLEADGETAEAVTLLLAAQAWDEALRIVQAQAPEMLRQGRGCVLETWLHALPDSLRGQSPWALYWLGRCRLGYDPVAARGYLEQAFSLFEPGDDAAGLFSVWASIIDSFAYEWGEFAPLDRWIDVLDGLLGRYPQMPTPDIEARVAYGMFTALMYRQPHRADLPRWAERVRSIVVNASDGRTQMVLGNQLLHYYTSWVGDIAGARLLLDSIRHPRSAAEFGPLAYIAWCAMEADYHWNVGAHEECLRSFDRGLQTIRQTGAWFAGYRLEAHGAMGCLMAGDFARMDKGLKKAAGEIPPGRLVYRGHHHFLAFLNAFYQGDHLHAVANAREAVALADAAGVPICQALYRQALAHALFGNGERREALSHLAQARKLTRRMRLPAADFGWLSSTAYFLLEQGKRGRALPFLRKTLEMARRSGYINRVFWTAEFTTRLFAAALEHGIEVEYVQESIRRRKLAPPPEALHLEQWPFPVRIHTLGRFSVLIDGKPLQFSAKAQSKPLELLMALVAFGGRDVSERQLNEALWPDAEGDAAHKACGVALHRLRKLLACDQAVSLRGSHLSLNARYVWVDAWAFERGLSAEDGKPDAARRNAPDKAVALYQGPFLGKQADLTWAIPLRERLRAKFMRHLADRGRALYQAGEHAAAIALFEKGLSADPLAEEFYRQLMVCYQAMDLRAEAIGVYQRCEKTLAATLGMSPASKTLELYHKLQG